MQYHTFNLIKYEVLLDKYPVLPEDDVWFSMSYLLIGEWLTAINLTYSTWQKFMLCRGDATSAMALRDDILEW